jgi:hypothetical protein
MIHMRPKPVVVEPEVLGAHLCLYDLGLYVKVSEWLPLLVDDVSVDDFITQVRYGRFGEHHGEADLRAGLKRLADAGLLILDGSEEDDDPHAP